MIFTDESGKIYEIPRERYSDFEVSAERAAAIIEECKKASLNNNEVSGYYNDNALYLSCRIDQYGLNCDYTYNNVRGSYSANY